MKKGARKKRRKEESLEVPVVVRRIECQYLFACSNRFFIWFGSKESEMIVIGGHGTRNSLTLWIMSDEPLDVVDTR